MTVTLDPDQSPLHEFHNIFEIGDNGNPWHPRYSLWYNSETHALHFSLAVFGKEQQYFGYALKKGAFLQPTHILANYSFKQKRVQFFVDGKRIWDAPLQTKGMVPASFWAISSGHHPLSGARMTVSNLALFKGNLVGKEIKAIALGNYFKWKYHPLGITKKVRSATVGLLIVLVLLLQAPTLWRYWTLFYRFAPAKVIFIPAIFILLFFAASKPLVAVLATKWLSPTTQHSPEIEFHSPSINPKTTGKNNQFFLKESQSTYFNYYITPLWLKKYGMRQWRLIRQQPLKGDFSLALQVVLPEQDQDAHPIKILAAQDIYGQTPFSLTLNPNKSRFEIQSASGFQFNESAIPLQGGSETLRVSLVYDQDEKTLELQIDGQGTFRYRLSQTFEPLVSLQIFSEIDSQNIKMLRAGEVNGVALWNRQIPLRQVDQQFTKLLNQQSQFTLKVKNLQWMLLLFFSILFLALYFKYFIDIKHLEEAIYWLTNHVQAQTIFHWREVLRDRNQMEKVTWEFD